MGERTTYTAEYKSKIVIEILQGEHTVSEIAARENLNVKQLSNWKREFLANAANAFNVSPQSPGVYPNQSQNVKITPNRS